MKNKIEIPVEVSNHMEGLMYDVNARKDLLAFMINNNMSNSEDFKIYHKEYVDSLVTYEKAKKQLSAEYIEKDYPNCSWVLDFATHTLNIEVHDE